MNPMVVRISFILALVLALHPGGAPVRAGESEKRPPVVLLMGDAMVEQVAPGIEDGVIVGRIARLTHAARPGTGFSLPEAFNWKMHMLRAVSDTRPDVVLIALGGEDAGPLPAGPGFSLDFGSPAWRTEYRHRVRETIAAVRMGAPHARVLLLGVSGARPDDPREMVLRQVAGDIARVSFQPAPALHSVLDGRQFGWRCVRRIAPKTLDTADSDSPELQRALRLTTVLSLLFDTQED
jgi:hypothetical protein